MPIKCYAHPNEVIKAIIEDAWNRFTRGEYEKDLDTQDFVKLNGNPTYISQYHKMLEQADFTVTKEKDAPLTTFTLGWKATTFKEPLEKEAEARKHRESLKRISKDYKENLQHDERDIQAYQPASSVYDADTIKAASLIIHKLVALSYDRSRILLTERDITLLLGYTLVLEEVKDALNLLGVSATLTPYSGINDHDTETIIIDWHNSSLYRSANKY